MDRVWFTEAPIGPGEVVEAVSKPDCGAVATFLGVVRGEEAGEKIEYLEYEAYREMAREELLRICRELRARWPAIRRVAIVHRLGRVRVGEVAVAIAVAAPRRAEVFPALAYAVDRLKEAVPIWKKEVGERGARWKPAE